MSITTGNYTVENDSSGVNYRRHTVGGVSRPAHVPEIPNAAGDALAPVGPANPMPVQARRGAAAGGVVEFTSMTSAQVLAANANRIEATVFNRGPGILLLLRGSGTVAAANSTVSLFTNQMWVEREAVELRGIFLSAGTANVQELT